MNQFTRKIFPLFLVFVHFYAVSVVHIDHDHLLPVKVFSGEQISGHDCETGDSHRHGTSDQDCLLCIQFHHFVSVILQADKGIATHKQVYEYYGIIFAHSENLSPSHLKRGPPNLI